MQYKLFGLLFPNNLWIFLSPSPTDAKLVIGGGKLLNILDIEKETIERALESKLFAREIELSFSNKPHHFEK